MTIEDTLRLMHKVDEEVELSEEDEQRIRMIGLSRVLRIKLKRLEESLADEIDTHG